MLVTEPADGIN